MWPPLLHALKQTKQASLRLQNGKVVARRRATLSWQNLWQDGALFSEPAA
jgi:hypothetical protein